jgi:transcriptional regulator with XRE-family HTH domain
MTNPSIIFYFLKILIDFISICDKVKIRGDYMLGDKVKQLRKKIGITQQELAASIGLSQSAIGMIEGNKQGASNDTLIKLATTLNTTVDYLLSNDTEISTTDNTDESIIEIDDDIRRIERARKKMDPKNKEKMMNILRSAFDEYFDD